MNAEDADDAAGKGSGVEPGVARREAMRRWREQNADRVRAYRKQWRAEHPERHRELNRETQKRAREREQQRRRTRERQRAYYEANAEKRRANTRQWRAARMAEDPEGFRAAETARRREWWASRPPEVRARIAREARDKAFPEDTRERGRDYYHRNADRLNTERRAFLKEHPEKRREYQYRWLEKNRKREAAGLPVPARHRTTKQERQSNHAVADEFFLRQYTAAQIQGMRNGPPTPPALIAAFHRDSARARAAHQLAEDTLLQYRLAEELKTRQPTAEEQRWLIRRERQAEHERRQAEDARLDEIGRAVNERLRHAGNVRRAHHKDPAAPHPMLHNPNGPGLNR
ncbi:hypothetical protein [Microbacterium lacus]|uniref:Uncharacterized protein n=1 Tax=Microbacterium lacus TaxID=415217 RepID=A0ABN2FY70_9MICO